MKHSLKITAILLGMFLLTQFIGLYVVNYYSASKIVDGEIQNVSAPVLPFGMETPEVKTETEYYSIFFLVIIAFVIAISVLFLFTKFEWQKIIKIWFFVVVMIALGITLSIFTAKIGIEKNLFGIPIFATLIALPFAFFKIFQKNFFVHNLTELLIYPGIATVFVPVLNIYTIIFLLILISIYDAWAVWKSGIMQKMAKYQMDKLNLFAGFFVPHADKKTKEKIKLIREKLKQKKITKKEILKKKFKINIAILGGGDVIFPIIAAGVMLKTFGFNSFQLLGMNLLIPTSALFVIAGATIGLALLFIFSEKKKFYPAMPFITAGIFLGMLSAWVLQII
jgi:presenilin-like A22 family membrane protease